MYSYRKRVVVSVTELIRYIKLMRSERVLAVADYLAVNKHIVRAFYALK